MRKALRIVVSMALIMSVASGAFAKSVKKNPPRKKEVLSKVKELGPPHYEKKMKISEIGPLKVGDTYYHAFSGDLGNGTYHIIIYDNNLNYLGFYETHLEPMGYEEGAILLDGADIGDGNYIRIPIPETGPQKKILLGGGSLPLLFVKSPEAEAAQAEGGSKTSMGMSSSSDKSGEKEAKELKPEYREWKIHYKGKTLTVRALLVERKGGKVYLKAEANGKVKPFLYSQLSKEDQKYLKQFKFLKR